MSAAERPVLIVDDDIDIREALSDTLEDRGFQVVTAANGRDALTLVRRMDEPPSAILLDLMMPVMDGYAFLAAREQDEQLKSVPVAVITAGSRPDARRFLDHAPLIPKPIDVALLFQVLGELGANPAPGP